jgi:hypothetical protein
MILKRAVEIEAISLRRIHLQDHNRAFHDPKPLMTQLEKELQTLLHKSKSEDEKAQSIVNWNKDQDWKSQLRKFQV